MIYKSNCISVQLFCSGAASDCLPELSGAAGYSSPLFYLEKASACGKGGQLLKFQIITVGKLKEKYLKDGIAEYLKRLQRYATVEIVEVADEQTPDHASEAEELQIKAREAQRIQKYIK